MHTIYLTKLQAATYMVLVGSNLLTIQQLEEECTQPLSLHLKYKKNYVNTYDVLDILIEKLAEQ